MKAVARAKRHGGCEFCILPKADERLTWHHVFGRGHIIAEPWASYFPLTLMICFAHHRAAHDQDNIRRAMEWMALDEFLSIIEYDSSLMSFSELTPVQIIRTVVRDLDRKGILPPGFEE